jgi:hypothetical protein
MENIDLTIILPTNNKPPKSWERFHRQKLIDAAWNYPIITVSRNPDIWLNIEDDWPMHISNLYWQMLRACKIATTPYIAQVEDDSLYTHDHFSCFRPPLDTFAYNINRWSVYTWWVPTYSWRWSQVWASLIAPRKKMIEQLEYRFNKYALNWIIPSHLCGEIGLRNFERQIGATINKWVDFYSVDPIIQVNHDYFSSDNDGRLSIEKRHRKRMWWLRSYDIPVWGKAEDIIKPFLEKNE